MATMSSTPPPQLQTQGSVGLADITGDLSRTGIVIVDHGSRRPESNTMLEDFVAMFAKLKPQYPIVEAAHMELAEPSIEQAVKRCVERGATRVAVCPYFLSPGKHWKQDIPTLTRAAAAKAKPGGVEWVVTSPIGLTPLMADVIDSRLSHCISRVSGKAEECESCAGTGGCRLHTPEAGDAHAADDRCQSQVTGDPSQCEGCRELNRCRMGVGAV